MRGCSSSAWPRLATVVGVFFVLGSVSEGEGAPLGLDVATGALAFVLLVLFRRDHPVALTLVLIPLGILFGMPMGATPVALFAVALHRPARVAVGLAALHAVAVIVVYRIASTRPAPTWRRCMFLVLLHVSLVAVAMLIRSQRMLVALAGRTGPGRPRRASGCASSRPGWPSGSGSPGRCTTCWRTGSRCWPCTPARCEVRRDAPATEREAAGVIRQCAYDALEDLRQVIGMLREQPAEDRPQPTLGDVPALVEESREAGATVDLELAGGDGVPDGVGRHAYRIVQEALTNARKHAPGAPVRVAVRGCAERGPGGRGGQRAGRRAAPMPGAGAGLVGLRERVQPGRRPPRARPDTGRRVPGAGVAAVDTVTTARRCGCCSSTTTRWSGPG